MKRAIIAFAAICGIGLLGTSPSPAKASDFGIHFSGPGYHFDLGDVHHRRAYYGGHRASYRGDYHRGGRGWYDDHEWHDTSHYDYHPAEIVPHRGHYHYVPEHYDFHDTGHWDHYHW